MISKYKYWSQSKWSKSHFFVFRRTINIWEVRFKYHHLESKISGNNIRYSTILYIFLLIYSSVFSGIEMEKCIKFLHSINSVDKIEIIILSIQKKPQYPCNISDKIIHLKSETHNIWLSRQSMCPTDKVVVSDKFQIWKI